MILAELQNWLECRTAILEYDNDTIYLYNRPHEKNLEMKSLWVANTRKRLVKKSNIKSDMDQGVQPYMPKKYCNSKGYISNYSRLKNWSLQWGLDQNSIAVYYNNQIYAIMPEWSGVKGFCGYSKGTDHETPLAWPLLSDNIQIERFLTEKSFLDFWKESIWISHQQNLLSLYNDLFQGETKYFAADEGKWPPLGLHYCKTPEFDFIATIGMSQLPMPILGMQHENYYDYTHIEIAILLRNIKDFRPLASYLSAQAKYPWYFGTHFDHGHTIPCEQLKEIGSNHTFMLITETAKFLPEISMPTYGGRATRLLFMMPIYAPEQRYAENNSSQDLLRKLENGVDPFDLKRKIIV